ncbi:hypothetical protein LG3211_2229 [Lysobacter gummosus]|nr:hypothetical protein LG3211_2229 [Lysobacter gummosus]
MLRWSVASWTAAATARDFIRRAGIGAPAAAQLREAAAALRRLGPYRRQ